MYIISLFTLGILTVLNNYFNTPLFVRLPIGLVFLGMVSVVFGNFFIKSKEKLVNFVLGLLILLFLIIIDGALFFYFYKLNNLFFIIYTLILPFFSLFLVKYFNERRGLPMANPYKLGKKILLLISVYLGLISYLFNILLNYSSNKAIRTPWEVLPSYFFVLFFVSSVALMAILIKGEKLGAKPLAKGFSPFGCCSYKLILTIIHVFLMSGIAYFIYKIGYGFDPFIHRATLNIIWQTGTISPKPLYYVGQYSLIFYLAKVLGLSVGFLDKILVPFLSALLLPSALYYYIKTSIAQDDMQKKDWLVLLSFFTIPFGFFIVTTPQNFANLLFLVLLILSLCFLKRTPPTTPCQGGIVPQVLILILNAVAIFFIHPLTGIPAILFICLYLLWQRYIKENPSTGSRSIIYKKLFLIIALLGLVSLPAVWLINSQFSAEAVISINNNIWQVFKDYLSGLNILNFKYQGQYKPILSLVYFFFFNLPIILLVIFSIGLWRVVKEKKVLIYVPYLISFLVFFVNYLFLKIFFNFSFLISYEREDYANRVLLISLFFLAPLFFEFLIFIWQKIETKNLLLKYFLIISLSGGLTAGLYLNYPRHDNFNASGGYSVSQNSIDVVRYIEEHSQGDYVVLADQQVSAAALQEYGFKKYYQTDQGLMFYYPIPTGKALYQYYLKMVNEKPTRQTIEDAMSFVGVNEGYFVINKYWWESGKIIEASKLIADEYEMFNGGEVYVFKFLKKSNHSGISQ